MTRISYLVATMVMAAGVFVDAAGKQLPAATPRLGAETSQGCFKSAGDLEDKGGYDPGSVSSGMCKDVARKAKALVFALKGEKCLLGDTYPPEEDLVDDDKCNFACPSYGEDACGGLKGGSFYSVFNTGIELDIEHMEPEETSETSSATPEETKKPEDEEEEEEKDSGSSVNVAGIAAGTVVAVVAIAGAIGGVWFYMRRKRNQEIEEEHRRNAAVNSFISGGHSSGGSVTDARLDPIMAQRRMSDGSIADNEDYSRRILRVTNV